MALEYVMSKYKILVVDDEYMNYKLLKHIMRDEPMYSLDVVLDPNKAIEKLKNEYYDLVLLDVMMPQMSGLETLRIIRTITEAPVVIMTGDKTLAGSKEYEELGCNDYITKPFLPLLIKEVIHNVCCDMAEKV